jgi:DNA-binding transcriptional MerR regulator
MPAFTIQDVSRRSGLSEPTLRYYEQVGLVGPIDRDERSGHRRYGTEDLHTLEALACLRVTGVGIEYMRTYKANLSRRQTAEGAARSAAAPRGAHRGRDRRPASEAGLHA